MQKSNPKNIDEIANISAQEFCATVPIIPPANGNLSNMIASLLGKVEDLYIKNTSVNPLPGKKAHCSMALEKLESTLRIGNMVQANYYTPKNPKTY